MKLQNIILIVTSLLIAEISGVYAQNGRCMNYHRENCPKSSVEGFRYSGQSRSIQFSPDQLETEFKITILGGYSYNISLSGEKELGPIRLQIYETDENGFLIFDNTNEDYVQQRIFIAQSSKKLLVKISAPKPIEQSARTKCAGIYIEYMKTAIIDF